MKRRLIFKTNNFQRYEQADELQASFAHDGSNMYLESKQEQKK